MKHETPEAETAVITPEAATVVAGDDIDTAGAPSAPLPETKIVVETTSAAGPSRVVVVQTAVAPTRPRRTGWLGWLRSLLDSLVAFVKALVPLVTAVV